MILDLDDPFLDIVGFGFVDGPMCAIAFGTRQFAPQRSQSGALIEKMFKFDAIMVHCAFGGPGEQDQQIIAAGRKAGNELFFECALPDLGGDSFAAWMSSNTVVDLLRVDVNNPEMEQFPEAVKGDTGMLL